MVSLRTLKDRLSNTLIEPLASRTMRKYISIVSAPVSMLLQQTKLIHQVRPRESSAHIHWPKRAHVAPCNCKSGKQGLAVSGKHMIHEPETHCQVQEPTARGWAARTSQTQPATGWIRLGQPLQPPQKPGKCHPHSQREDAPHDSRGHSCPLLSTFPQHLASVISSCTLESPEGVALLKLPLLSFPNNSDLTGLQ